jgi:hypothetical protein
MLYQMKHQTPHIVFDEAPLSYLLEGRGMHYNQARGMDHSVKCEDPSTICYHVIIPGGRLIGKIECSDTFGVDLHMKKYLKQSYSMIDSDEKISLIEQKFSAREK